jgi:hypothetical protein
MKILFRLKFILPLVFCAGCIPYHYTLQPGAIGTVVDAKSGTLLPNTHVVLSRLSETWNPTNRISLFFTNQVASTTSTNDGAFRIQPKREWGILFFVPTDFPWGIYELKVENTNYQTLRFRFASVLIDTGKQATTNFGAVKLQAQGSHVAR